MRKLLIPKKETKFENQILNCTNKIVAKIVSEYSKNEIHFFELYQIGISKWKVMESNFLEKNINKSGALIIRQEILNYTLKMESKKLELEKLQNEVAEYYKKLGNEIGIVLGFKIFYSRFSENADILFIGINPGAGEQIQYTGEEEMLEYINDYKNEDGYQINNYALAKETLKVFELADYPNLLKKLDAENKVVKINSIFYVDTKNSDGENVKIGDFTNTILTKAQKDDFYRKSYEWTYKLIQLINPKIIICEGKTAYYNLYESIPEVEINKNESNGILITKYDKLAFTMLTYNRNYSNIDEKEFFAKILKVELDKIYK
ncbi:hypothetical protein [Flavobacterium psychrophilum]|uniref:hypothetical protein n=1 Tax=Flavobacterium psychrophilum TaxID=96345 RepID=UPI001D080A23|nr:hypothetical protein [Flavobacterium psychrophilum]MCB6089466.1 hypothetical protein [Flavobacterium psychrophilum]